jgi:hypothetical protein
MTDVQRQLNKQVVLLFLLNLAFSLTMTIGSVIVTNTPAVRLSPNPFRRRPCICAQQQTRERR